MPKHQLLTVLYLALGVAGCGSDRANPTEPPPEREAPDGLWFGTGVPPAIVRLRSADLGSSGERQPATTVTTGSAGLNTLVSVAFDAGGNLWVASADDSLVLELAAADLGTSGSSAATTVIRPVAGSLSAPTGLAFDAAGRLWVANHDNGTIVRYDADQLAAGGTVAPAVVISGAGHPTSLAFDFAGALWVTDNVGNRLFSYRAADLEASGAIPPAVVLTDNAGSLVGPGGLAFDGFGHLWVANTSGRTVVAFGRVSLLRSGAPLPGVVLTSNGSSIAVPTGLVFGADSALWVVGAAGALTKFGPETIRVSGAPEPAARLTVSGHSLLWSAAFWPRPVLGPPL